MSFDVSEASDESDGECDIDLNSHSDLNGRHAGLSERLKEPSSAAATAGAGAHAPVVQPLRRVTASAATAPPPRQRTRASCSALGRHGNNLAYDAADPRNARVVVAAPPRPPPSAAAGALLRGAANAQAQEVRVGTLAAVVQAGGGASGDGSGAHGSSAARHTFAARKALKPKPMRTGSVAVAVQVDPEQTRSTRQGTAPVTKARSPAPSFRQSVPPAPGPAGAAATAAAAAAAAAALYRQQPPAAAAALQVSRSTPAFAAKLPTLSGGGGVMQQQCSAAAGTPVLRQQLSAKSLRHVATPLDAPLCVTGAAAGAAAAAAGAAAAAAAAEASDASGDDCSSTCNASDAEEDYFSEGAEDVMEVDGSYENSYSSYKIVEQVVAPVMGVAPAFSLSPQVLALLGRCGGGGGGSCSGGAGGSGGARTSGITWGSAADGSSSLRGVGSSRDGGATCGSSGGGGGGSAAASGGGAVAGSSGGDGGGGGDDGTSRSNTRRSSSRVSVGNAGRAAAVQSVSGKALQAAAPLPKGDWRKTSNSAAGSSHARQGAAAAAQAAPAAAAAAAAHGATTPAAAAAAAAAAAPASEAAAAAAAHLAVKRAIGVEEQTAGCKLCGKSPGGTLHARLCQAPRVKAHDTIVHNSVKRATQRLLRQYLKTGLVDEDYTPFLGSAGPPGSRRMDIVLPADAFPVTGYDDPTRHLPLMVDVTCFEAQVASRATKTAADPERCCRDQEAAKTTHYSGHYDQNCYKLATLAIGSFGSIGEQGRKLLEAVATEYASRMSVPGGARPKALKGIALARLRSALSAALHMAYSGRVMTHMAESRGGGHMEEDVGEDPEMPFGGGGV
ncbi:hypothetical protein JKP88DRAFT_281447 [Tribonema minus]|uniref:Uncharacterized protein n=1 Tax=Tribonema minus TaxID=303371 RepID=A0A835YMK1_9STRA|nr:hypothetical protein JKP88DRAFT_281447 [Tribonema minus]